MNFYHRLHSIEARAEKSRMLHAGRNAFNSFIRDYGNADPEHREMLDTVLTAHQAEGLDVSDWREILARQCSLVTPLRRSVVDFCVMCGVIPPQTKIIRMRCVEGGTNPPRLVPMDNRSEGNHFLFVLGGGPPRLAEGRTI